MGHAAYFAQKAKDLVQRWPGVLGLGFGVKEFGAFKTAALHKGRKLVFQDVMQGGLAQGAARLPNRCGSKSFMSISTLPPIIHSARNLPKLPFGRCRSTNHRIARNDAGPMTP